MMYDFIVLCFFPFICLFLVFSEMKIYCCVIKNVQKDKKKGLFLIPQTQTRLPWRLAGCQDSDWLVRVRAVGSRGFLGA